MNIKRKLLLVPAILLLLIAISKLPAGIVSAADTSAITFGTIDYDQLTLQVYNNGNSIVYYSTDNSTWTELEGSYSSTSKSYTMDISWIPGTSETTLYMKGDTVKTVKSITLPTQNTDIMVTYDKVEGEFTFENVEESETFQWRKTIDYTWTTVSLEETSSSYIVFLQEMEYLRVKGAKIIIRIPQVIGSGAADVGMRPSKEVTISIIARGTAPTVKVDSSKLTLNTTTALEYYDTSASDWMECTKSMTMEEIAPKALYMNGGNSITLKIRKMATTSAPYSKSLTLTIPGQAAAPTIGGSSSDVTYYYMNSKLMLQFNKASTNNLYEYAVVKSSETYEVTTAKWKTVKASTLMTIASSTAPSGCTIYVRKKGTDAIETKNVDLVLASEVSSFAVNY